MPSRLAALLLVLSLVLAPTTVLAGGVADEADLQFQLGADDYGRGNYRGALEHFLASNRLVPNRNVMFNIARAYEQLGRFPEAYRYYADALRDEQDAGTRREVEAAIARVTPRVAVVEVTSTPPGATVYLDRKDLGSVGTTPARLGLAAGSYSLIVELPGHERRTVGPIALKLGARTPLTVELPLIVGFIDVAGLAGTEVRLDDERGPVLCAIPCRSAVPPGAHQLFFRKDGFRAVPRTLTVTASETTRVSAELVAETGSIVVETDEPGAAIEVDGERVGFSPFVVTGVPIGTRRVRITLRGYQPIEREVVVAAERRVTLDDLVLDPLRQVAAASREAERIDDAPASVTIIDGQELAAFAYPTILEALRGVRGFAITHDSIYGNASVRGLGLANDYNNRLLVLTDGAVLNENVAYQPLIRYDGRVDLGDLERIEIVRGPASVLYGTGAMSGVINLVLRGRDTPEGVHGEASTYDDGTARIRIDGARRFGDDAGGWLSLAMARSSGNDVALTFDSDGDGDVEPQIANDFDRFTAVTAAGKLWWRGLTVQGFYTQRDVVVPTGPFAVTFNDPRNLVADRRFLAEAKYERAWGAAKATVRAYLNWSSNHDEGTFFDEADPLVEQRYRDEYRGWWGGVEARLALTLSDRLKLSVGVEGTVHTKALIESYSNPLDQPDEIYLDVNAPYQVGAGYGLLDWKADPRVAVQAGLRFDYWRLGGNQRAEADAADVVTTFPALSPRVAVIVKPSDRDVVKLMAGSAFRAPSTYELYGENTTQALSSVCGTDLEPEIVYSAELEASRRWGRDWIGLVAAHATYARDIIETAPVPDACLPGSDIDYYRNSPVGQTILGADVELRREWRSGVMLSAHYGLLQPRYARDPDPAAATRDRTLLNAPTQFAGFKGVVPLVPGFATGALRLSLEDPRRIDLVSTARSNRAVVADLVVSGTVTRRRIQYAVGVYNLFDWRYALPAFVFSSDLMPQGGRSLALSLGYSR